MERTVRDGPTTEGIRLVHGGYAVRAPPGATGAEAATYDFTIAAGGKRARLRQLLTIHQEAGYAVSFVAAEGRFDEQLPAFDAILESWRWR